MRRYTRHLLAALLVAGFAALPAAPALSAEGYPELIAMREEAKHVGPSGLPELRKRAERGDSQAQFLLALVHHDVFGTRKDDAEAARWFRKAAGSGFAWAEFFMGEAYELGKGVKRDPGEALRWYRRAAGHGNPPSMARLGLAYRYGTGVPRNLGKAVAWLKRGVEADDGSAMLLLGDMTLFGLGTPRSYDEALVLYRKADARNYRWREPVLSMLAGCSEEFCRLLWTAVVARYSNFEPLRGGEEPKGWSATIALPGAEACLISKEKASRYRCFYGRKVTPGKADRIFRDLVARVRATLPAGWRTQMKTDHPREKWAMSFLAGPPGPTPAIAVDQVDDAGAERPGLRTVQLTVLNAGAK